MSDLLKKADELKKTFKIDEAVCVYSEYLKNNPDDAKAAASAGICYLLLSDFNNAYEMFKLSLKTSNNDDLVSIYKTAMEIILNLPYSFSSIKDKSIILDNYTEIMEIVVDKKNIEAGYKLFQVFLSEINNPEWFYDADNQYRIILIVNGLGDYETAEIMAKTLMKRTEFSWQGLGAYGAVLISKGMINEAKEAFKSAMDRGGEFDKRFVNDVMKANYKML